MTFLTQDCCGSRTEPQDASTSVTLSIVILCWNDLKVIRNCISSIYAASHTIDFEVIVSDNASTDGSPELIRQHFPKVRVVENRGNLGFAKGNNAGIKISRGEFVLILNPDTMIHEGALDNLIAFAKRHPEAGAFGCRVLNADGSYQGCARPFPTIWAELLASLYLRPLAYVSDKFISDTYTGWKGNTERIIDWQAGCAVMFRADVLKQVNGFDEQFFYHFEDVDLCRRVWNAGYSIVYTPDATITHLGGQSVNRFPIRFELERYRSRYRYFYKHFGPRGAYRCRWVVLVWLWERRLGYRLVALFRPSESLPERLKTYRVLIKWHARLDPVRFVEGGEEPALNEITAS